MWSVQTFWRLTHRTIFVKSLRFHCEVLHILRIQVPVTSLPANWHIAVSLSTAHRYLTLVIFGPLELINYVCYICSIFQILAIGRRRRRRSRSELATYSLVPFQRSSGVTSPCASSNAVNLLVTSAANCRPTASSSLSSSRFRGGMLCCLELMICLCVAVCSWIGYVRQFINLISYKCKKNLTVYNIL